MNDPILMTWIKAFAQERGLTVTDQRLSKIFEMFSAYSILRKYHDFEAVEPDNQVAVGGAGDGGLDAVAILLNQTLVRSMEDVDAFLQPNRRFNVEFIFVQAKLSKNFHTADIGHFADGVKSFFDFKNDSSVTWNSELTALRTISKHLLYETTWHRNPDCYLYYVNTGKWQQPQDPTQRIDQKKQDLEELHLFDKVHLTPIDSDTLKSICRDLKYSAEKDIEFPNCATFPEIEGVQQAYIGLLSGDQYIRLISQEDGSLNRDLFYNNIRDFQGDNAVNEEIHQTISSDEDRKNFPLMNNGITIVARSINRTGNRFKIADYQIVNGCQTSHVLHLNNTNVDSDVFIPTKLVATEDSRIIDDIIKANNRQTEIKPEAWESLTPFHKELEEFYLSKPAPFDGNERKVYYERRSKQYFFDQIPPSRIVTLPRQIQSFIGMFLNEPHSHHRYYGELLKSYDKKLFVDGHKLEPYYTSGVTLLAVEQLGDLQERGLSQYKYHILMLLRVQISGQLPPLNSNRLVEYCSKILDCLSCRKRLLEQVDIATKHLERHLNNVERLAYRRGTGSFRSIQHIRPGNPPYRLSEFTNDILKDAVCKAV